MRTVNIANLTFQSKTGTIANSLTVLGGCKDGICNLIETYSKEKINNDLEFIDQSVISTQLDRRPTRRKTGTRLIEEFIVDAPRPSSVASDDKCDELRRTIVELKDIFVEQIENRFSDKNTTFWASMEALSPTNPDFFVTSVIEPLYDYAETIPVLKVLWLDNDFSKGRLQAECTVFKNVILNKFHFDTGKTIDISDIYRFLKSSYASAAPILIELYKISITCGYASARVECLFSSMTFVDSARRRSSTPFRECSLTHLHFERNIVKEITFDEFAKEWCKKPRSLNF